MHYGTTDHEILYHFDSIAYIQHSFSLENNLNKERYVSLPVADYQCLSLSRQKGAHQLEKAKFEI